MTILGALTAYYDRLAEKSEVPPFGYSVGKIGWCLVIEPDGTPRAVVPLSEGEGRKVRPLSMPVPQPTIRTSGIASNFLWDKTAYVLGVTAGTGRRTGEEHAAFAALHRDLLDGTDDPGLRALLAFVDRWTPDHFVPPLFPEEMKDGNLVFRVGCERRYLHDTPTARALCERRAAEAGGPQGICLVTGARMPIARLHPTVKGVWGSQSAGARIVSFNCDAFKSYGKEQGDNAPVGEAAAFAYTTVLNRFLAQGSRNRVQIGDTSTVFWADGSNAEKAGLAEAVFGIVLGIDDDLQANKVKPIVDAIAQGRPLAAFDPELSEDVRFHVLGLSPNAARLSVRYWFEDRFGPLADNIGRHARDLRLEPAPRETLPGIWRLLIETAVQRKSENIPPQLAGEMLRAILSGGRYPATLLSTLLMRLRADGDVTALRVAMLKAIVARNHRLDAPPTTEEPPVSFDPDCTEPGYLLGRLFAAYENAQTAALGRNVNATVKDKYYAAASSTPQTVFPLLDRGAAPHIAKLRKQKPGTAVAVEREIAAIMDRLSPGRDPFPRALPPAQQALFALGYYHQRENRFVRKTSIDDHAESETANEGNDR
ncbi:MAG: type I-C CRISPR-associated protein Cas8c/Csd1 [Acetobacterales bacterium]